MSASATHCGHENVEKGFSTELAFCFLFSDHQSESLDTESSSGPLRFRQFVFVGYYSEFSENDSLWWMFGKREAGWLYTAGCDIINVQARRCSCRVSREPSLNSRSSRYCTALQVNAKVKAWTLDIPAWVIGSWPTSLCNLASLTVIRSLSW